MGDFITMKVGSLEGLNKALNELDLKVRKRAIRPALKRAITPIAARAKANVVEDTGGLKRTIKASVNMGKSTRRNAGRKAAAVGKVRAGSGRKVDGVTGHQALQVEYGTSKTPAKPFMRPAIQGHEPAIVATFSKELGRQIKRAARTIKKR